MKKFVPRFARLSVAGMAISTILALSGGIALANHSWGTYHWARKANPFTLKIGDNVTSAWDSYLRTTSTDWSTSAVLDTTVVSGASKGNCQPTLGRVEVCNKSYGSNGWLGIASVWANGTHITQGTVKMNDTYFNTATYNKPAWRNLVMCQEVGHTLGLDHQDEIFTNANLGTCMDYTNDPTANQHPNAHDFEELATIYAHLDASTTIGSATNPTAKSDINTDDPKQWGKVVRNAKNGKSSLFERDLGGGEKVFTFVIWAE